MWIECKSIEIAEKIYADLGYSGEDMRERIMRYGIELECVGRKNKKKFEIERTFAWLGKFRRLSKDYELITNTSLNMIASYDKNHI